MKPNRVQIRFQGTWDVLVWEWGKTGLGLCHIMHQLVPITERCCGRYESDDQHLEASNHHHGKPTEAQFLSCSITVLAQFTLSYFVWFGTFVCLWVRQQDPILKCTWSQFPPPPSFSVFPLGSLLFTILPSNCRVMISPPLQIMLRLPWRLSRGRGWLWRDGVSTSVQSTRQQTANQHLCGSL